MGVHGDIFQISPLQKTVAFLFKNVESAVEGTALFLIEGWGYSGIFRIFRKSLFPGYLQAWEEALDAELLADDSSFPLCN